MTTFSWCARDAFRRRVSMSPMGSLTGIFNLSGGAEVRARFLPSRLPGPPRGSREELPSPGGEKSVYHELLMSPVISPWRARLRRQMRHIWNLRRYARGRPHKGHRLYLRVE